MKNNSKKTNKQNTARSAQNTTHRMSRRTKEERRNILFSKTHVKMENRRAVYGTDHGVAYALARVTDLNRRFVAAFLALVFAISTMVVGLNFVTSAEDPAPTPTKADSNLVLEKTISAQPDGTYDLELSAYAKGAVKNTTKQIPTDYVLVVDQSGSMKYEDMPTDYQEATMPSGGWKLSDFEGGLDTDGNSADLPYYYKDKEGYHRVYRKWGDIFERVPRNTVYCKDIVDSRNLTWFRDEIGTESDFNSQYYYQPASDINITRLCAGNDYIQPGGENDYNFYPLTISSQGRTFYYSIRLNYKDSTGTKRYLRFTNNNANTTANKDLETGACIWYKNPSGRYFGPGDRYLAIVSYNAGIGIDANDFVINWINGNANWDSFYTYGQITSGFQSGMFIQNTMFIRHVNYNALAYRDFDGNEHIIDSTDYCDKQGQPKEDVYGNNDFILKDADEKNIVLYEAKGESETRLESVKNALSAFVESVASQTDDNGVVDHRIAIVGFSSPNSTSSSSYSTYSNTELLTNTRSDFSITTGSNISGYGPNQNGVLKTTADATPDWYKNALVNASNGTAGQVNSSVSTAINALTPYGGTVAADGLDMAYEILTRNDRVSEYANGSRNAVVVFFTDGRPGFNYESNQYTYANNVVSSAHSIKTAVPNVQLYSVGVFGEADGNPLTHYVPITTWYGGSVTRNYMEKSRLEEDRVDAGAGDYAVRTGDGYANPSDYDNYMDYAENIYQPDFFKEDGTHQTVTVRYQNRNWIGSWTGAPIYVPAYTHTVSGTFWREALRNTLGYPQQQNDTISDYMTVVSSAYPKATSFDGGWISMSDTARKNTTYNAVVNGARKDRGPGRYYFTASDADKLTEIFVNIAGETTTSALSSDAELYLQDIVSDKFIVPSDPQVDVKTYMGRQQVDGGEIDFPYNPETLPASQMVSWNGQTMTVNGFNFAENYIMHGKPALLDENDAVITPEDHGKKLVVTIHGLVPKAKVTVNNQEQDNIGVLASNTDGSGILETQTDEDDVLLDEFISPEITRYKYDLDVGDVHRGAVFDIDYTILQNNAPATSQAVVLRGASEAHRSDSLTNGKLTTTNNNDQSATVYAEYITKGGVDSNGDEISANPAEYTPNALVKLRQDSPDRNKYIYYLDTAAFTAPHSDATKQLNLTSGNTETFNGNQNGTLYVRSLSNNYTVTIKEKAEGPFSNTSDTFTPTIILMPNVATTATSLDLGNGIVAQKDGNVYKVTLNNPPIQGNEIASVALSIPAGYTLAIEQSNSGTYYNAVEEAIYTDEQSTDATYTLRGQEIDSDTVITIKNFAPAPEPEGVNDSNNHNWIIYILAALGGLAAIGTGIFLWKKKDEFVEE